MDANPFHTSCLAAPVHFPVEITFADRKHPAIRLYTIKLFEVILDLVAEEFRHLNYPVTFRRFGICDHILLVQSLVGPVNADRAFFKIELPL